MFKVIISAIVALGFSAAAYAQEGEAPAPSKMDTAAPAAEAPAPAAEKPAKKAKHKHGKHKKSEEAPKAE